MLNMTLNQWRYLCAALVALLLVQFYFSGSSQPPKVFSTTQFSDSSNSSWSFDHHRDSANIALSSLQCDQAFPDLYYEIDRAEAYWAERGQTISKEDISLLENEATFTVLLYDNQLFVTGNSSRWLPGGHRKRSLYILSQLHRAVLGAAAIGATLPSIEFSIAVGDMAMMRDESIRSIFAFTRKLDDDRQQALWLIPDFNFFASPPAAGTWQQMQAGAAAHDGKITDKIPKVLWRGVTWTNEELRGGLLNVTRDKEWADVEVIDWGHKTENIIDMDDYCRYMFLVHTEGRSYSGRLNYLLNCNSLSIVHDLRWTTFFYHLLIENGPNQNYIPVKRDFSDLEDQINRYLQDPVQAQRIADQAVSTFRDRYTTPAAEACYWRRLIESYNRVAFKPDPFEMVSVTVPGIDEQKAQLRGIPFEEILLRRAYEPPAS